MVDVIATKQGVYGGRLREVGERFTLASEADRGSWMAPVDSEEAAGAPRQRTPIATPARAETGPNAALAANYAEAGMQTTALLIELQDARVELGQLKTQVAETEALRRRVAELEAQLTSGGKGPTAKQVEAATAKAGEIARKAATEQLKAAVEAANEAREDHRRSEEPELSEEEAEAQRRAAEAPAPDLPTTEDIVRRRTVDTDDTPAPDDATPRRRRSRG